MMLIREWKPALNRFALEFESRLGSVQNFVSIQLFASYTARASMAGESEEAAKADNARI
jgi:hypothetical protein